jgi:hypothetical protein
MSKGGLLATKAQQWPGGLIFRTAVEYSCFQLTDTCLLNQSMIFSRYPPALWVAAELRHDCIR